MTTETIAPEDRTLRPAAGKTEPGSPAHGAFSPRNDPRLAEMATGSAFGTSMLVLYPVFACVIVVLTSLTLSGAALPA
ncbi:hypothetical protein [Mesorhizobium australicum]|uniref:Uncharacterized protein n=1 Tax=Mesorhizobium australicum TaxID=536018 RepID=A0A1X7NPD2_9HYPH|nr:hypothetical protein [Mesorhizobium australicum]SMH39914.1 hypothetical protein SAMN02982922_2238 [Mesorhizobium australicum]